MNTSFGPLGNPFYLMKEEMGFKPFHVAMIMKNGENITEVKHDPGHNDANDAYQALNSYQNSDGKGVMSVVSGQDLQQYKANGIRLTSTNFVKRPNGQSQAPNPSVGVVPQIQAFNPLVFDKSKSQRYYQNLKENEKEQRAPKFKVGDIVLISDDTDDSEGKRNYNGCVGRIASEGKYDHVWGDIVYDVECSPNNRPGEEKRIRRFSESQLISPTQESTIHEDSKTRSLSDNSAALVDRSTSACLEIWYSLTREFNSHPDKYDPHPTEPSDKFMHFKLSPGLDARDESFKKLVKGCEDLADKLNDALGRRLFEPEVLRKQGSLEARTVYAEGEGGIFKVVSKEGEVGVVITMTMPKQSILRDAFKALITTPNMPIIDDAPMGQDVIPPMAPTQDANVDQEASMPSRQESFELSYRKKKPMPVDHYLIPEAWMVKPIISALREYASSEDVEGPKADLATYLVNRLKTLSEEEIDSSVLAHLSQDDMAPRVANPYEMFKEAFKDAKLHAISMELEAHFGIQENASCHGMWTRAADKRKKHMTEDEVKEELAANSVGGGGVAGLPPDEPPVRKKPKDGPIRRRDYKESIGFTNGPFSRVPRK